MSTWGDVASAVSKFAPILGNAVPGVGTLVGAGVGLAASVIAKALGTEPTPDSVMTALQNDPDAIVKLKQAEMDHERDLAQIAAQREQAQLAAEQANTQAVNQSVQTEAKADHWPTYAWRPFVGFCFGFAWIGAYFVIPILRGWWPNIAQPSIPPEAWIAIGGILGVASFFRGKMQADPAVPSDNRG